MSKIKAPTLLVQGQKDTLFNLNEASTTYAKLKAQGTPVKMVWQSWGHSGSEPVAGELDFGAKSLRDSFLGRRFLDWMDHYVRGTSASTGPEFAYFRDWVPYDEDPSVAGTAITKAYASSSTVNVGRANRRSTSPATTPSRPPSRRSRRAPPPTRTPDRRPRRTPRPRASRVPR